MHCFHSWLALASLTGADALCSTHVCANKTALVTLASSVPKSTGNNQRLDKAQEVVSGRLLTATSMSSARQTPLFAKNRSPLGESWSGDMQTISTTFETEISTPRPQLYWPVWKKIPYLERMQKLHDRTLEMKVVWVVAPLGPVVWAFFCLISKAQECSVEAGKGSQLSSAARNAPLAAHVSARKAHLPSSDEFTSTEAHY